MNSKPATTTKTLHALKSPYTEPSWPTISPQLESAIVDALLLLLTPIRQYRDKVLPKSKSKRRRKKSEDSKPNADGGDQPNGAEHGDIVTAPELRPLQYLTIGFNSTIRQLEVLAQRGKYQRQNEEKEDQPNNIPMAILVCTSMLPDVMTAPLPLLVATASATVAEKNSIRLIPISKTSATEIAACLGLPRANVVGIQQGNLDWRNLEILIRDHIQPMVVPWIQESMKHQYLPVKIHSEQVTVSPSQAKREKRKRDSDE